MTAHGSGDQESAHPPTNRIATALQIIAYLIFAGGFITGMTLGGLAESVIPALIYWGACAVSGIVFLGFAEIILLLQKIVDIGKLSSTTSSSKESQTKSVDLKSSDINYLRGKKVSRLKQPSIYDKYIEEDPYDLL
jgi:hypothetical protein